MWPFSRSTVKKQIQEVATIPLDYKPSISFENNFVNTLTEQFKGEVEQNNIKFPAELGEEHPFNFKKMETLYEKFSFFTAVVDKYVDFVVGPGFYIECDDARAKKIIEDFMKDVNFDIKLRQWTKEALIKGNGFMEIGGNEKKGIKGLKILNANYMYVVRDKKGKIEGYNQYKGAFDKFAKEKVIPFEVNQIAHVPFNIVGDNAYGIGIGYSAMKAIDDWLSQQKALHKLMDRKANAPLHAQLGIIDGDTKIIPKPEDVSALGRDIETMSNKTEWTTDPLVNFKVIDFGNFGEKFATILENDLEMMIYAFQIPAVLLGKANIPEGLAKVQMEAFQRRIQSIQAELEKIIEENIFKRVLKANGLEVDVEFEWGTPSVMEVEGRMTLISEMIKSPMIGDAMKSMLEDEMINLLKFNKDEWEKLKLEQEAKEEEERKRLEAQPQPIVPGQNAKFPQKVAPKKEQPKQPKAEENIDIIKQLINQIQKESIKPNKKIRNRLYRKTSLLPPFKVVRKTEYVNTTETGDKPKDDKLIIKIKRAKGKENYEYEKKCSHCTEKWDDINDISEWLGFSYAKFLGYIALALKDFDFEQIKAVNEIELQAGYLTGTQIEKLRKILDNGFKKGLGMKEMAKLVDKNVILKDLYRMTAAGDIKLGVSGLPILSRSADKRAISIVRTEVTRMANKGAVEYYKDNDVKQIKHIASFGDRTCMECAALDGTIYTIGEEPGLPVHPMCRCTYGAVVELK